MNEPTAAAIEELVDQAGSPSEIFAEGLAEALDDQHLTLTGYLIDTAQWDAALAEGCGVWWEKVHEVVILEKARALGWVG